MFRILKSLIPSSVKDSAQRVSSSRIQSYYLLGLIYLYCVFFIIVEIISMFKSGKVELSSTIEQIFWSLLAHHIVFAGVSKNSKSEPSGDKNTSEKEGKSEEESEILKG